MTVDTRPVTVTIPGKPVTYGRTATVVDDRGRRRRILPLGYRQWREKARDAINIGRRGRHLDGQFLLEVEIAADEVRATFTPAPPVRTRGIGVTGDLDNYVKAVLDAAQDSGLIANDRQAVAITARFTPGARP